ncbi:MAG: 30S ribosomal protein S7 [Candidatus Aenigmarchaeota archaeon]|nr:30S ribosomal protein S7 [Candidatus Aenigmarchaeota archaeon]
MKFNVKLFGRWDSNIEVMDPSLKGYINLEPRVLPRSGGVHRGRFHKSKMHILERLALKLMVSGHTGKKHKLTSGKFGGAYMNVLAVIEEALDIIEKKENKNPIEVLVRAIENASLREEVISYQLGSIMAREAVITAPQRRVDKTLRYFAQAAYRAAFNKKKVTSQALADEILAAYKGSTDSFAIKEKDRVEREAMGAR